jgi:hypothetical protein
MRCAAMWLGCEFVREPLHPGEKAEFHPTELHGKSAEERARIVCAEAWRSPGIKHVHGPVLDPPSNAAKLKVSRQLLGIKGLKVILLSRRNVRHQFLSMEVAYQNADWWSHGPAALPESIGPLRAGTREELSDEQIARRVALLAQATIDLRQLCFEVGADFIERTYEELFEGTPSNAIGHIQRALRFFDADLAVAPPAGVVALLNESWRLDESDRLYRATIGRSQSLQEP